MGGCADDEREKTEKEASTSEAVEEEPSGLDAFSAYNFWKLDISDVDLLPPE